MRWGAGRPGWRGKVEHCLRLDVRRWARDGLLVAGQGGGWQWKNDQGQPVSAIGYRVEAGGVVLSFTTAQGQAVQQRVPLLRTACTFGGERQWFGCPVCGGRVALLYLRSGRFACRSCQRLAYACQSEDGMGRAWRKQSKAEARLEQGIRRPKGMHLATYRRLRDVIEDCEAVRDEALVDFLSRHLRR